MNEIINNNKIVFVNAAIKHIPQIVDLRMKLWNEAGKFKDAKEFKIIKDLNIKYHKDNLRKGKMVIPMLMNEEKDEIISIGIGVIIDKPPVNLMNNGKEGYIYNVYTSDAYRKHGCATFIINKIMENFKSKQVT